MSVIEIQLFGPPSVRINGDPMPRLKTRKGLWALSLLALRHDRDIDRIWLAGTLWPDADESTSLTYLRQTLTDLRKALGPASSHLESTAFRSLRLRLEDAECDVARFDDLVRCGTPEAYEEAIALYSGPLLEGCTEEWVFPEREARSQAWLHALETLADYEVETGNPASAIRRLRQVIAAEPLRESAYRALMRALAALGDSAAVMETYRDLRLLVKRELNVEPDPETRSLFEAIRSEVRTRATAGAEPVVFRSNSREGAKQSDGGTDKTQVDPSAERQPEPHVPILRLPSFVSEFIGREREITAVRRSIVASRLVTLTGVGGVGKTRLAVRIAEEEASRFTDGVVFVDFTPLAEATMVPGAVATALKLREKGARSALETITNYLETRAILVILDNCEHVLSACAELASELLKRCPDLRILATSRQRLRISGETEWRVLPLELPPESIPADASAAEALLRSNEALTLFMDRALRVRPNLVKDIGTLRAAAVVCRRLDGIPLALELAAARLQALTVAQLSERLEERFKLLVMGDLTAPERQQTLRAMLDWSYDLLSEHERALFRRLAVFAVGWNLEAAETVCSENADSDLSVLDGLASLVDKSLVLFSDASGTGRYGLLETVRQYACEKLARSGEEADQRRKHVEYFLAFAEEAARHLKGPEQAQWLDRLETEYDNLRAALDWCAEKTDDASMGLRLASALRRFWFIRGRYAEGRRRYEDFLRKDTAALPTPERAAALQGAGILAFRQGDYAASRDYDEQSLAVWQELGDPTGEAEMLTNLGVLAFFQGDYERARPLLVRGLELHRATGNQANVLVSLHNLGNVAFRTGDRAKARELYEQGLAESRECGSLDMEATFQNSLGIVHDADGDYLGAQEYHHCALITSRELKSVSGEIVGLINLGNVARKLGDLALSAQYFREGLLFVKDREGDRDERVVAYLFEGVAFLALSADKPGQACWLLAAADALRDAMAIPRPPLDREEFARAVAEVHAVIDSTSFDATWLEGQTARVESAISKALETVAMVSAG